MMKLLINLKITHYKFHTLLILFALCLFNEIAFVNTYTDTLGFEKYDATLFEASKDWKPEVFEDYAYNQYNGDETFPFEEYGSEIVSSSPPDYGLHNEHDVNLDYLGSFMKMFSVYTNLFELPGLFNSRIALKKRIISKPSTYPKKVLVKTTSHISPFGGIIDGFKDRLKAIYPGTLWCGDGSNARSEHEVGLFQNTDICCRMHDKCPASIQAGHQYKGLQNNGLFTRSHCDCDRRFYNCLKKVDSIVSNKVGYTYFNILRPQCFRKEYPVIGCKKWGHKKCYVYVIDNEQPPSWQWFDNKLY